MDEKKILDSFHLSEESFKKINKSINRLKKLLYFFFLMNLGVIIFIIIIFTIKKKIIYSNSPLDKLSKIKDNLNNLNEKVNYKKETEKLFHNIEKIQNFFCDNLNISHNDDFEKKIKIADINFQNKTYNMNVYIKSDIVSNFIITKKNWEKKATLNILEALNYYSNKYNINNKDIYIIDIGANIGWYSILFGKYGFKVISFEPTKINHYILNKNYCLNKEINITIINKGLYNEDKKCYLYNQIKNEGNGYTICDKYKTLPKFLNFNKTNEIILTKLSNYLPFFSDKNLSLIKIDIEGSEGKAIEGGIDLITKYHVPFIFLEFTPFSLKIHDTDPRQFLQLFIDNGYKISHLNFFDKNYYSIEEILKITKTQIDLYIVYSKILE